MSLNIWGPLTLATLLFVISASIKLSGFTGITVVIGIGSEFALWAVGVLFSLAASEGGRFQGRIQHVFERHENSIHVNYVPVLPEKLDLSPKTLYLFVFTMSIWILTVVLTDNAQRIYSNASGFDTWSTLMTCANIILAATNIGIAIGALQSRNQ